MAGDQLPVLTLDFDDEKIRQLNEIAEKFKAALGIGPGGFPATVPGGGLPVPGDNHRPKVKGDKEESGFDKFLKNLNKEAKGTLKTFGLINKTLGVTTSTLKGLFTTTLSWGTKLAAFGASGFLGFDMLAKHSTQNLMNAQGLGLSNGQVQAADSVFGSRFSATDSTIQALANARNNPTSKEYKSLMALGLNPEASGSENLPKFFEAIDRVRKKFGNNAMAVLGGMGVDWFGANDMNQVAANSNDIPKLGQQFRERSERLDNMLPAETQRQYQGTYSNLTNNADQIGNSFLAAVAKLSPAINGLSDTLTKDITGFLNGPNGQAVFKAVSDGLQQLGTWLASPVFQSDLKGFLTAIGDIAKAVGRFAKWILGFFGDDTLTKKDVAEAEKKSSFEKAIPATATTPAVPPPGKEKDGSLWGLVKATGQTFGGMAGVMAGNLFPDAGKRMKAGGWYNYQNGDIKAYAEQVNDAAHLPRNMMSAMIEKESGWDPKAVSKAGAKGLPQFIDSTARAYGLQGNDVFDPKKSSDAMSRYLQDNMRRYGGDITKTLAQYNGGSAAVKSDGTLSLKMETVKYLQSLLTRIDGAQTQHPYLMHQLKAAHEYLDRAPNGSRATIKLMVDQKPGSDINVQAIGQFLPH